MRLFVLLLGLLRLAAAGPTPGSKNVHGLMTDEEIMQVFQTEHHAIPEYEVVPMHWPKKSKRNSESPTPLKLNAFGTSIKLWLHPTDDVLVGRNTPVFMAKSVAGRFEMHSVDYPMASVGKMLEDRERQATLMKKTEQGLNTISGFIGEQGWYVKPLPNHMNQNYRDRLPYSLNDTNHIKYNEPHYHMIYKQPEQNRTADDYASIPIKAGLLDEQFNRSKCMDLPEVIYPQVLIIADFETYRLHDENLSKFLEYLLPFWNGVDLRYRPLKHPKVRFNIAGIIIGRDHDVFPFISRHLTPQKTLYVTNALSRFSEFLMTKSSLKQIFPSQSYDIAIAMVPYKMYSKREGPCNVVGEAYIGGACSIAKTGIIIDNGNFDGIITAVHEVGHLFGVEHDTQGTSAACANKGYIMSSYQQQTKHVGVWSNCSMRAMQNFFRCDTDGYGTPDCLYNKPNLKYPLPRVLPGSIMTRDEQCMRQFGTRHCDKGLAEEKICLRLYCFKSNHSKRCKLVMSPVDGTICGTNKICWRAKCVDQQ